MGWMERKFVQGEQKETRPSHDLHHSGAAAPTRQSGFVQSVVIVLLRGRSHHPTAVVTVTAGQHAQLLQGLLVV